MTIYAAYVKFAMDHAQAARDAHQEIIDNPDSYPPAMVQHSLTYVRDHDLAQASTKGGALIFRHMVARRLGMWAMLLIGWGLAGYAFARLQGWL